MMMTMIAMMMMMMMMMMMITGMIVIMNMRHCHMNTVYSATTHTQYSNC